jgi:hypothetical protein
MRTLVVLTAVLSSIASLSSAGDEVQVRTFGDPSIRKAIDDRSHAIYDGVNKPGARHVSLITRDNPFSLPAATGTEATAVFIEGIVGRIVASVWTRRGKYSVEYYYGPEGLLLVYESFAYFEDVAPRGTWRNFMGLPGWERRSYFNADHIVAYAEARGGGAPPPGSDGIRLNDRSRRITSLIQNSRPRRTE